MSGDGSSPRGRGTRDRRHPQERQPRIIPAWAGNAQEQRPQVPRRQDHPRVGGERCKPSAAYSKRPGSSPRGRGTRFTGWRRSWESRIIPAWAGNARIRPTHALESADHPRVGGERSQRSSFSASFNGSSPRGRGTPARRRRARRWPRIIPAWAGNASRSPTASTPDTDHPRVGGERNCMKKITSVASGSSPRGRGTRRSAVLQAIKGRIIPAWAGNARPSRTSAVSEADHPRVGGERIRTNAEGTYANGSSPRGRGTLRPGRTAHRRRRIIPAWAGNAPSG